MFERVSIEELLYIIESPFSTPLSNQQTFVHIKLLFIVENLS